MKKGKDGFYNRVVKRTFDFLIALFSLIVLSPLLFVLTIVGAIAMKGNPFFCQKRPGMIVKRTGKERIINVIKFRTMTNAKAPDGTLLSDSERLTKYGRFLRSTSMDELPQLVNILIGDLALIGPRPLLVSYLPYYTEEERHRHDVRPGLTGWAQVHGRNAVEWSKRLALDVDYVNQMSLALDIRILFLTVKAVVSKSDVAEDTQATEGNLAEIRKAQPEMNVK